MTLNILGAKPIKESVLVAFLTCHYEGVYLNTSLSDETEFVSIDRPQCYSNHRSFDLQQMGRFNRKNCLRTCTICADPDRPGHAQNIIRILCMRKASSASCACAKHHPHPVHAQSIIRILCMRKASSASCACAKHHPHPVHAQSIIRILCMRKASSASCTCAKHHPGLCLPFIHFLVSDESVSGREGPDQPAQLRRLIWAFASAYAQRHVFAWRGPIFFIDFSRIILLNYSLIETIYCISYRQTRSYKKAMVCEVNAM